MSKKRLIDYHENLMQRLKNPKLAIAYLNEAITDEDQRVFLLALKDVIEAQDGDISRLARAAKLNRPTIYRMLSQKGNPRWLSLNSLVKALGLQLQVINKKDASIYRSALSSKSTRA